MENRSPTQAEKPRAKRMCEKSFADRADQGVRHAERLHEVMNATVLGKSSAHCQFLASIFHRRPAGAAFVTKPFPAQVGQFSRASK